MRRVLYWLIYQLLFLDFKNKDSNCVGRRYQWKNKLSFDVMVNEDTGEEEHERARIR